MNQVEIAAPLLVQGTLIMLSIYFDRNVGHYASNVRGYKLVRPTRLMENDIYYSTTLSELRTACT